MQLIIRDLIYRSPLNTVNNVSMISLKFISFQMVITHMMIGTKVNPKYTWNFDLFFPSISYSSDFVPSLIILYICLKMNVILIEEYMIFVFLYRSTVLWCIHEVHPIWAIGSYLLSMNYPM